MTEIFWKENNEQLQEIKQTDVYKAVGALSWLGPVSLINFYFLLIVTQYKKWYKL